MSAANQIDYIEFQANDLAATKQFFEQLLGWTFTDYGPDYTTFTESGVNGGFARGERHSTLETGGALVVIYHPRLEETRQRILDLGGKITHDIFSFPGGRRLHFTEPSGNECAHLVGRVIRVTLSGRVAPSRRVAESPSRRVASPPQ